MTRNRGIGDRLNRAKTPELQREVCQEWATSWHHEQTEIIKGLYSIIKQGHYQSLEGITRKLEIVTEKRFTGLKNVVNRLTDYELVE